MDALSSADERRVIGLMSGTSADGVGAALISVRGAGETVSWELAAFETVPLDRALREEILSLQAPGAENVLERLARLHFRLGAVFAGACVAVAARAGYALHEVGLVGMHGQTVFHGTAPGRTAPGVGPGGPTAASGPGRVAEAAGSFIPATLQIGEAAVLAERTGISVVSNFRARDVAAGGTGAPLVPFTDYLLFRSDEEARLCLNLGGIANVTALPIDASPASVIAFDTGPGNMVIDALVERFTKGRETFDQGGTRAAQAPPDAELLAGLMATPYLAAAPPKSAGREEFGAAFAATFAERVAARKLSPAVAISTATSFTAKSIADAYRRHILPRMEADAVLVSGGGVHNRTLMERLAEEMDPVPVRSTDYYGLDPDAKEAVAFALLADAFVHGVPGNLPSVTGASHPVLLGAFVPGGAG